jgi:hypothetical protein
MANFKFPCPACGYKIVCDTAHTGTEVHCPSCQRSILVPAFSEPVIQIKVSTLKRIAIISLSALLVVGIAWFTFTALTKVTILKGDEHFYTPKAYRPPVEITVVAKTDSTNLRLAYAADQIIFNWEMNPWQLRVDGGPANGLHKDNAGHIPRKKYVTVRWVVTTTHQSIYVDGQLRYRHDGDYSQINRQVSIFPANGSTVTIKSVTVKPIPDSTS